MDEKRGGPQLESITPGIVSYLVFWNNVSYLRVGASLEREKRLHRNKKGMPPPKSLSHAPPSAS